MIDLVTKSAVMNEIMDYITELKESNNYTMSDKIFAANVILDKIRRMEPYAKLHIDLVNSKSYIQNVNSNEEINNE